MSDIGEGMIFVGQLASDLKKGDFSKAFKGCGACGCVMIIAIAMFCLAIAVLIFVALRS